MFLKYYGPLVILFHQIEIISKDSTALAYKTEGY